MMSSTKHHAARGSSKLCTTLGLVACAFVSVIALSNKSMANSSTIQQILSKDVDLAYGEYLASECATCHNPNGDSSSSVPVIHGAQAEHIVESLLAYRSGDRINSSMQDVAGVLGDEEIAALAAYLSSNP